MAAPPSIRAWSASFTSRGKDRLPLEATDRLGAAWASTGLAGRSGREGGGDRLAQRLGPEIGIVGRAPLDRLVGAGIEAGQPAVPVDHAPGEDVAELIVAEHEVEIGPGVIGDHPVADRDVVGRLPVVDVELGDDEL